MTSSNNFDGPTLDSLRILLAIRSGVVSATLTDDERKRIDQMAQAHLDRHQGNVESALRALLSPDEVASVGKDTDRPGDFDTLAPQSSAKFEVSNSSVMTEPPRGSAASFDSNRVEAPTLPPSHSSQGRTLENPLGAYESNRFSITRELGRGGLGFVCHAIDHQLGRAVAVKHIRDDCAHDEQFRSKFALEASLTGHLEHPGIIPVYAYGKDAMGRLFYAMRLVEGLTLRDEIQSFHKSRSERKTPYSSLELRALIGRLVDVGLAVEYAHSRGVLHRDLKPSNIMVGKFGETILLDWGLAKNIHAESPLAETPPADNNERAIDNSLSSSTASAASAIASPNVQVDPTMQGQGLGTPGYAAPEQLLGDWKSVNTATDVYGLGAILYEILTGRLPVEGRDAIQRRENTLAARIVSPRLLEPQIPKPLAAIAMHALQREPGQRYPTARKMIEDLEHWLADEPTSVLEESVVDRSSRWFRRHRSAALTAAAALVLIAVVTTVGAFRINGLRIEAKELADKNGALAIANGELANDEASARAAAETSRDQAEGVTEFLVSVLGSPNPSVDGREVKVADVLIKAFTEIDEQELAPGAKLSVLLAITRSLNGLGLYNEAIPVANTAVSLAATADLSAQPIEQFKAWNESGKSYLGASQLETAAEHFNKAIEIAEQYPEEIEPASQFAGRNNLVNAYRALGQPKLAIEQAEALLPMAEEAEGADSISALSLRTLLAVLLNENGDSPRAVELLERNLKTLTNDYPDQIDNILSIKSSLGSAYRRSGRLADSVGILREVVTAREDLLGPSNDRTIITMNNLAMALKENGDDEESFQLLQTAYQRCQEAYGDEHRFTQLSLNNLAHETLTRGDLEKAKELFERVLDSRQKSLPENHPELGQSENNLGFVLFELGDTENAILRYRKALQITEESLPENHPWTVDTRENLLEALIKAGGPEEEIEKLRESLESLKQKDVP